MVGGKYKFVFITYVVAQKSLEHHAFSFDCRMFCKKAGEFLKLDKFVPRR